jgi:hypothetical protein
MKLRKLQRLDEDGVWFGDAYAFENSEGQVVFQYNLAWGRVGAACNVKLRESGVSLEEIETVISSGDELRWLPVEVIEEEEVEAFLAALDEACAIPKPRSIAHALAA